MPLGPARLGSHSWGSVKSGGARLRRLCFSCILVGQHCRFQMVLLSPMFLLRGLSHTAPDQSATDTSQGWPGAEPGRGHCSSEGGASPLCPSLLFPLPLGPACTLKSLVLQGLSTQFSNPPTFLGVRVTLAQPSPNPESMSRLVWGRPPKSAFATDLPCHDATLGCLLLVCNKTVDWKQVELKTHVSNNGMLARE